MADDSVGGVLDGAIVLDVAQGVVAAVLDGAVVFQAGYDSVRCVLDGAVGLDVACDAVGGVLDGAIVLDVGHYRVARALDGLGAGREAKAEDGGQEYEGKVAHRRDEFSFKYSHILRNVLTLHNLNTIDSQYEN